MFIWHITPLEYIDKYIRIEKVYFIQKHQLYNFDDSLFLINTSFLTFILLKFIFFFILKFSFLSKGQKFDNTQLQNKKINILQEKVQDALQPARNPRHEALLLKDMLQLSIKKEKIEKALSATGYQNSMNAINWLMRHAKDPFLNQDSKLPTREYALVLCPVGRLAEQIGTFIELSKKKCTNDVVFNNFLPYMKLTSFFKVLDIF